MLRRWKDGGPPPIEIRTARDVPWWWSRLLDLREWADGCYRQAAMLPMKVEVPRTYFIFDTRWWDKWIEDNRRHAESKKR